MAKQKFYAVWVGRKTGVYKTWEECKEQTEGFSGAKYKSYITLEAAEEAFNFESVKLIEQIPKDASGNNKISTISNYIEESICVDAACNTITQELEYRLVNTQTGKEILHRGPFPGGTNNIGEFLAIVLALIYCDRKKLTIPVYSDSMTAMKWVKDKAIKTTLVRTDENEELFNAVEKAIEWLEINNYKSEVLKWETSSWGENPADFGRKR